MTKFHLLFSRTRWLLMLLALLAGPTAWAQATLTSFSPSNGVAGTLVTLTGTGFTGATAVRLNGTAVASFAVASATSITAVVPVGATSGTFSVTAPAGTATSASSFTVDLPRAGRIVIDGYRESRYGAAVVVQTNPTQFGNATNGSPTTALNGSELDAAYTYVHGDSLYVFLAGNIENNGNSVEVFFDTQTGGQNVLSTTNPNVDGNGLNAMGGLRFDTNFSPDFYLSLKGNPSGGVVDGFFASLGTAGSFGIDPAAPSTGRMVPLTLGAGRMGMLGVDQSNTGGVDGGSVYGASSVVRGLEFVLPLAALGNATGTLLLSVFVNGGGHGYLSNQVLAGLPANTGNLAGASTVNFANQAGAQYFGTALPVVAASISAFSPTAGSPGTTVTLTGTNFTGATGVSFGGTAATSFTVVSATSITAVVPAGAVTSTITVTTPGGSVTTATPFTVTGPPTLTGLTPGTGVAGTAVTLTGANLTGATALSLNGTAITGYTVNTAGNQVTLLVPTGATSGTFAVTTPAGTASSTASFTVQQPRAGRIVLDGYRESRYGAALALQTVATQFGNSATGLQNSAGGGSELDAAYTYVHGDSLYVFLAGNIENNGNSVEVFFDTQTGGQNVLAGNNPNVDNNGLNAMAGLTFDAGFTADYYLSLKGAQGGGVVDAFFASLGAPGTGVQAATGTSRQVTLTLPGGRTGLLGVDQSNTGGVDANSINGAAAASVVTGLEFVLPLAALGSPATTINISAFVNGGGHGYLSNQVLAGLPAGTTNLAAPNGVNFATQAGNQYFTTAIPQPATITSFSPASGPVGTVVTITGTNFTGATSVSFGGTAATSFTVTSPTSITATVPTGASTGLVAVTTAAGAVASTATFTVTLPPTITSFAPTTGVAGTPVTITGTSLDNFTSLTLNGTAINNVTVNSATSLTAIVPAGATSGTLSIVTPSGTTTSTGSFVVQQPRAGRVAVDGYRETAYGTAAALQTAATQFGNSTAGDAAASINGSELDAAYTYVHGDSLYVFLAGNLENNGNTLDIFFDTQTGGQNVLANNNPNVDNNGLNAMAGLTFDSNFTADYYLGLKGPIVGGVTSAWFASLGAAGTGLTAATSNTRQATLTLPGGLSGRLGVDQSNTGGIDGTAVYAGAPAAVVTGFEFALPLAALGWPVGPIRISAFVNNDTHGYLSNQVLGGLPAGTANLTSPATVNFASQAGDQFFGVTIPAAPATVVSFTPASGAVGTTVTLTGTYFTGATGVSFGGTAATSFTVVNATTITAVVPAGAPAGAVSVTTALGTASSASFFCVQYTATGTGASRCGNGTVALTGSGAPAGGTYNWYTQPTGGTPINTPGSYTTPVLTATTTYYVSISTGSGSAACDGPRTALTATVNPVPAAPVVTGNIGNLTATSSAATGNQWYFTNSSVPGTATPIPGATGPTIDALGTSGQGYYSVTTTSAAGCESPQSNQVFLVILGTRASALAAQVLVHPNPTQGRFVVQLPGGKAQVQVLNALGQQVLAPVAATGTARLDLTGLARGVYAVRVQLGSEVVTKRVVLE